MCSFLASVFLSLCFVWCFCVLVFLCGLHALLFLLCANFIFLAFSKLVCSVLAAVFLPLFYRGAFYVLVFLCGFPASVFLFCTDFNFSVVLGFYVF